VEATIASVDRDFDWEEDQTIGVDAAPAEGVACRAVSEKDLRITRKTRTNRKVVSVFGKAAVESECLAPKISRYLINAAAT
jgi:hypothetical protein